MSLSFEFIRKHQSEGNYIDDFPEFHGIGENFKKFAKSKQWVRQLNSDPESAPRLETEFGEEGDNEE